ncbi:unnamed protein product [Caenorhabditis angaria]|uniref:tRNA (guanine-N(7)-)-methyltransferase non-catalytic subunit n=1 Tax=Caenorhabditis angaria TaxID=860376 RepID=A0A9P1N2W9_9PELO|nr:unnamed protein product [Caenorhabditis angaria]
MSFVKSFENLTYIASGPILSVLDVSQDNAIPETLFEWENIKEENIIKPENNESNENEEGKQQIKKVDEIVTICFAHSNGPRRLLAVGTNQKLVHVLEMSEVGKNATHLISAVIPKAPTSCSFDKEDAYVIVGDRSGDVHRFSIETGVVSELAGAISMVLSVGLTQDGKRLLMADRDEKLRIVRYPNTFVIEAFCLGHTEYVRSVASAGNDVAYTAGGDGFVREWQIDNGKSISSTLISSEKSPIRKIVLNSDNSKLAVILEKSSKLYLLKIGSNTVTEVLLENENEIIDLEAINDGRFVVLSRNQILLIDSDSSTVIRKIQIDGKLLENLGKHNDAVENLFKNVTFNNQQEYEKRKTEKFAKVEEKKALKRKAT